jgi:aryl-alcohol dehydrogenase-like predicted oxidoreductase
MADTKYSGDDVRCVITQFEKATVIANQPLLELITGFAKTKDATPVQISLVWMLRKKKIHCVDPRITQP